MAPATHPGAGRPLRPLLPVLLLALAAACGGGDGGGERGRSAEGGPPAAPVRVTRARIARVPISLRAVGTVLSPRTVTVRPQITGRVQSVHFREGQEVRRGDLLVIIDPRPFRARLDEARAALGRARAEAAQARDEAARYRELVEQELVAPLDYITRRARARALGATVEAARAAVEQARLALAYTRIASPLDGRTGALLVDPGNVVQANTTALLVIRTMAPVEVSFAVPERELADVREHAARGRVTAQAFAPGTTRPLGEGRLTFMASAVDPRTGTLALRATFPNRERRLWPGQFVDVRLVLGIDPDALVVPDDALQRGPEGEDFLYLVGPGSKAVRRRVQVERRAEGLAVIARGLRAGEPVITAGQVRLVPGARVTVQGTARGGKPPVELEAEDPPARGPGGR